MKAESWLRVAEKSGAQGLSISQLGPFAYSVILCPGVLRGA
jgi:hypothetical protein